MKDNQLFSRYEFKYLIRNKIADILFKESLNFMDHDQYAASSTGYFVRSLYFDNDDYDNFFEKVDGIKFRKKFRIRTYGRINDKKTPIFLEAKGRIEDRIFKKRFMIDSSDLELFYSKKKLNYLLKKYNKNHLIEEFVYDVYRKKVTPRILIDYNRKPLVNKHGLYFRLTFDSNLKSTKTNSLFKKKNFISSNKCKPGYTILEVKFERSIPVWFHRTIQAYDLRRQSISKFVYGICNSKIKQETSD
jgi:SPX domain protein involved in polyphosphate accumulation|tara:strand:+ start:5094 stop:5831 length:738 start_codon:yes stop_codon:yes gene_type:complete